MLQIVASLTLIIYDRNMFIGQVTAHFAVPRHSA
jgi:hypothetical protein